MTDMVVPPTQRATLRVGYAPPDAQALERDRRERRVTVVAALDFADGQKTLQTPVGIVACYERRW